MTPRNTHPLMYHARGNPASVMEWLSEFSAPTYITTLSTTNGKRLMPKQIAKVYRLSLSGSGTALTFSSNRKQTLRRPNVHYAFGQCRSGHEEFAHRIGGDVSELISRSDDQNFTVFIRQINLAICRHG